MYLARARTRKHRPLPRQYPLEFVGEQSWFRWGGAGGRTSYFNRTTVSKGTSPPGSMWAMNPVPRAWRNKDG